MTGPDSGLQPRCILWFYRWTFAPSFSPGVRYPCPIDFCDVARSPRLASPTSTSFSYSLTILIVSCFLVPWFSRFSTKRLMMRIRCRQWSSLDDLVVSLLLFHILYAYTYKILNVKQLSFLHLTYMPKLVSSKKESLQFSLIALWLLTFKYVSM